MNWSDLIVIGVIGAFTLIGYKKGFIYTMFKIASFFVSIVVSIKCYPIVSKMLVKTPLFDNIKGSISKSLQSQIPGLDAQARQSTADAVVHQLQLPGFLKNSIIGQIPNPSSMVNTAEILNKVSDLLARLVMDIVSVVVLYIAIRIALFFARFILEGIAKLPLFKQMDKLGGIAFGAVEGLLTVYIVFAVLMLFHTAPQFKGFFEAVDTSLVAKFFYQKNFIINWMFPAGGKF